MPLSTIEVRQPRTPQQVQALMQALHQAQCEVLRVPEHDRQIRYVEHRPEHFAIPPGCSDAYTLVEVKLFAGRTLATKRAFYQAIVQRFEALGIPRDEVFIVRTEMPLQDCGLRGGQAACDLDLGFKLDV